VSALATYLYAFLLFGEAGQIGHVLAGALIFSLAAVMMLAVFILCSSLTKNSAASGGLGVLGFALLMISGIHRFSPNNLISHPVAISTGYFPDTLFVNAVLAVVVMAFVLVLAVWRLKRAEG